MKRSALALELEFITLLFRISFRIYVTPTGHATTAT